ncbi:hypothetical protein [Brevibacillus sp. SIMBA_040]|uniref:hypothetical protein n=1 Tax=unclassified Brevibacillus TaxID=2684853 RepID=UPI00397CDF82
MKRKPIQGLLAAALLVTSLWSGTPAFAYSIGEEVNLSGSQPEISQAGFDIGKNYAVWINQGEKAITLYDLAKNKETKIGNNNSTKTKPKVDGDYVVWIDSRGSGTDIYMYDISNEEETKIATGSTNVEEVEIAGNNIVWSDGNTRSSDIYLYNIATGEEEKVSTSGKAIHPTVSESYVAWEDSRDGNPDIYYYDIKAREEKAAVKTRGSQVNPKIFEDKIAYENRASDNTEIYLYTINTERNKQLTEGSDDQTSVHIHKNKYVYLEGRTLMVGDVSKSTTSAKKVESSVFDGNDPRIFGDYVLYAKRDNDRKLHLFLYDIDAKEKVPMSAVAGEPSSPDGDDRYVVYLSESKKSNSVVLFDTEKLTSKVISKAKADPIRPLVSGRYVVWYDNYAKALVSYDIRKGVEKQLTDQDEKLEPNKEMYELDGKHLLWLNEGRRMELMLTDLSTGKHTNLITLKNDPLSIDIYDNYASWVIEQSRNKATISLYEIDRDRVSDIRKNVQIEEAKLGDNIVVWSEYTNGSNPSWDLYYYNIKRGKIDTLTRYTELDQKNPQVSHNMVLFKDNRLSRNSKDFYYELYDAESGSYVDLSWSDKAEASEVRIGGNRVVWIDDRDDTPQVFTMAIASPRDDDDDNEPEEPTNPGETKEYNFSDLLDDGTLAQKIKGVPFENFFYVFYANTSGEVAISLDEALDDSSKLLKYFRQVPFEEIVIRIKK